MSATLSYTLLGTGGSHGIPCLGCSCRVCTSEDPRDKRRRCSLFVETEEVSILFDTPPDFREQALTFGVNHIDALFLTHAHADHIMGFDDVRRLSHQLEDGLPVYAPEDTIRQMREKFGYVEQPSYDARAVPRIQFSALREPITVGNLCITPLPVPHGPNETYGYRIDSPTHAIAYIPDCSAIPKQTRALLDDLDVMILDGLRPSPHPTHLNFEQAATYLKDIRAKRSIITHITHSLPHSELQDLMAPFIVVGWDGLRETLQQEVKRDRGSVETR